MTKQTEEALKMAIEALDRVAEYLAGDEQFNFDIYKIDKAYLTCKEALALSEKQHTFPDKKQPAQEPMYFALTKDHTWLSITEKQYNNLKPEYKMKFYTHPAPSWQGLSDEAINDIAFREGISPFRMQEIYIAIKQASKERNICSL